MYTLGVQRKVVHKSTAAVDKQMDCFKAANLLCPVAIPRRFCAMPPPVLASLMLDVPLARVQVLYKAYRCLIQFGLLRYLWPKQCGLCNCPTFACVRLNTGTYIRQLEF